MPKPRPAYQPGGYYHFYNRGCSRHSIFQEQDNYYFVMRKMKHYMSEFAISIIAFCLMPNHYHFLVRQDGSLGAGLLPQRVFNSYSKAYNKLYGRSGTLFEGPYKVKEVVDSSHLLHLCRYIQGNPVKDGLVSDPEDWLYSNYLECVGQRDGIMFDAEFARENFSGPTLYRDFVLDDLRGGD